jgi:phenylacetate-CoA ligase
MNKLTAKYLLYYPTVFLKGEKVHKYLKQYLQTQWWHHDEIKDYQITRLFDLLKHAKKYVPFYKTHLNGFEISDIRKIDDLQYLPTISKEDLRVHYNDLLSLKKTILTSTKTTGGSTGEAITIIKTSEALARERAATWRSYLWSGIKIGDPQARFWGVPLTFQSKTKYKIVDFLSNRIRLSAFDFDETSLKEYYTKLIKFRPVYLYGYVSVIETFARFIDSNNLIIPFQLKCIITTSEILTDVTKKYIEKVFDCRVYNEYGCGEVGSIAHECEFGNLHLMSENLIVEVLKGKEYANDRESGEIVVTELNNYAMPLIRYRLSDFVEYTDDNCQCGRGLSMISKVIGRAYDMIKAPDGKLFHGEFFLYIFENAKKQNLGVKQFQVIQVERDKLNIKVVPDPNFSDATKYYIKDCIVNRMGIEVDVNFEMVNEISRERSGKIRLVKTLENFVSNN